MPICSSCCCFACCYCLAFAVALRLLLLLMIMMLMLTLLALHWHCIVGGDCVSDTSTRRQPFQGTHHLGSYPSLPPSHGPQAAPGMLRFSHGSLSHASAVANITYSRMPPSRRTCCRCRRTGSVLLDFGFAGNPLCFLLLSVWYYQYPSCCLVCQILNIGTIALLAAWESPSHLCCTENSCRSMQQCSTLAISVP